MSTGETSGPIHPTPTQRSGYRSLFYDKHHGADRGAARWLPDLSHEDEFAIFDAADLHDLSDERGWLYGIRRRGADGKIPDLGTWEQQVAEFPFARPGEPWHGYPIWFLNAQGPPNRKKEQYRPSREVFEKMERAALLTAPERKRLYKGKHI